MDAESVIPPLEPLVTASDAPEWAPPVSTEDGPSTDSPVEATSATPEPEIVDAQSSPEAGASAADDDELGPLDDEVAERPTPAQAAAVAASLHEAAALLHQTREPAAEHIVERVTARVGEAPAPEPTLEPAPADEHPAADDAFGPFHVGAVLSEASADREESAEVASLDPGTATDGQPDASLGAPVGDDQAFGPFHVGVPPLDAPAEAEVSEAGPPDANDAPDAKAAPVGAGPATGPALSGLPPIVIPPGAVIGAAIDVGATSLHLLVAAVGGHKLEPILDESVFLGLGDRVAAHGRMGHAAREELIASLVAYAHAARQLGAAFVTVVGTDPLRGADDAAIAIHEVEARAGVPVHVLEHEEEGRLTLLGVTKGLPIRSQMLVVDVGGGSTEFVVVGPDGAVSTTGLPLGAARLTKDIVRSDPPSLAEIESLKSTVKGILAYAPDAHPGDVVAVGGTASNLLKLLPATALDRVLTRRRLTVALAMLTVERSLEAAERHLVRPARARILPAGAIIVDAILEHYEADRLRVSEEGIREGLVLAVAAAGPAWRDQLPALIRGWDESAWPID